ncbi:hypothetical protein D7Y27_00755 [Corallococcus sp. AB004]|uniref:hypothetical protein n=1 Tax=Corallococcus exiguus TaxID=83462 RepID=UPI000EA357FB|nr:hypothetical protein [Corallococcus exiguus]NPC70310.1 hypothetical protein [Corallococcus exiguus]NPD22197.1 hypothetical protein [Corallococcus exiguus]RKI50993.1 hypothetical protein D7Y27_00755 [Corallococcus sp. AB004]
MKMLKGMLKGGVLGIPYAVAATTLALMMFFGFQGWMPFFELTLFVAAHSAPAGAVVGAGIVLTRAYQRGCTWRAQLVMVVIYVLVGFVGLRTTDIWTLEWIVRVAPAFLPLGLLATWAATRWIKR